MFEEYQEIIDDAKQQEKDLIKTFQVNKEKLSLKIKTKLEEEQTRITTKCELKDYSPIEFRDEMDKLTTEFKNLITEQENNLTTLKIETNKKLTPLLGKFCNFINRRIQVKDFYKIILSDSYPNHHIKVWFTLIDIPELGCEAGDIFKIEEYIRDNSSLYHGTLIKSYTKSKDQYLYIPLLSKKFFLQDVKLHDPKQLSPTTSNYLSIWQDWVNRNKPIVLKTESMG